MDEGLGSCGVAADGDGHFPNAKDIEHVELSGGKGGHALVLGFQF
jgi:hypothetical protein